MNAGERGLRRADEQELRLARAALGKGHFVIVVAGDEDWPLARSALDAEGSAEFTLGTGQDVVAMFASPEAARGGVVVLHVDGEAAEAMGALNLNRDELIRRPGRFILRLHGDDALRRLVSTAPDTYSVRDALAIIEGENSVQVVPRTAPPEDLERRIAALRSPGDLRDLGIELLRGGHAELGHRALERGISLLAGAKDLSPHDRSTLAALHYHRADLATPFERWAHVREALRVLWPVREWFTDQYANILAQRSDSYGTEIAAVREALALCEQEAWADSRVVTRQLGALATACWERDDIPGARQSLKRVEASWLDGDNLDWLRECEAHVLADEGRWREAIAVYEGVIRAGRPRRRAQVPCALAALQQRCGELSTALHVVETIESERAEEIRAGIRCARAEPLALRGLEACVQRNASEDLLDGFRRRHQANELARAAARAGLLDDGALSRLDAVVAALPAEIAAIAPREPPWALIDAELLVADHHLACADREPAAAEAAHRALALARTGAPELIARCVRRVAVALLRLRAAEELEPLLDEALRSTDAHHLPGEAARVAGVRLWLALQRGSGVAEAEAALEAAFARTGSVLVQAEVLLRVGRGAGRRDLIARARRIYRGLPWPEREGACFEALGMPDAARDRYEAFGLRLAALAVARDPAPPPVDA